MHLTVHDGFEPGDQVLLQRVEHGDEAVLHFVEHGQFATHLRVIVAEPVESVTFANIEPHEHWHITIRRAGKEA